MFFEECVTHFTDQRHKAEHIECIDELAFLVCFEREISFFSLRLGRACGWARPVFSALS